MATLMDLRNALALQGRLEASQLSQQLTIPLPMVLAMLTRLEAMGKAQRVTEDSSACLTGSCKHCPEGQSCSKELWSLR
ncbi:[Fe-S]-dependent transcriptional repressor FeoC [Citrobacter sp. JGM124]|uniref:[Fe-S]-dependent transcriptional repressor FeoC n=1 Tax=Citrobacter sp. JGM124 TaxID=2799789 RepID=UPI001BAC159F|nr:[Fe-S]-dependent transcriptional repressor FeoC [Citrobacter sp. JGM124]MBS0848254.1 [Fe-S]-dependent transcriptional repressor FeoC [Citrobacter sp. JGM124]